MDEATKATLSKVPEVTLGFWIIKIAATTLGETGGDSVTMTLNWGYLAGTAVFLAALIALVGCQMSCEEISPLFILGHDSCLDNVWHNDGRLCRPFFGRRIYGRFNASVPVSDKRACAFGTGLRHHFGKLGEYSQGGGFLLVGDHLITNAGTALGDWLADTGGLGYEGGALVFGVGLAILAAAYYWTSISRVTYFG